MKPLLLMLAACGAAHPIVIVVDHPSALASRNDDFARAVTDININLGCELVTTTPIAGQPVWHVSLLDELPTDCPHGIDCLGKTDYDAHTVEVGSIEPTVSPFDATYRVALHELGHALGLGHVPDACAIMNGTKEDCMIDGDTATPEQMIAYLDSLGGYNACGGK